MLFSLGALIVLLTALYPMQTSSQIIYKYPFANPAQTAFYTMGTIPVVYPMQIADQAVYTFPTVNLMQTEGYFEGDMKLTEQQMNLLTNGIPNMEANMVDNIWPNNKVTVLIDPIFQQHQVEMIYAAMNAIMSISCVCFQIVSGYTSEPHVKIAMEQNACWSEVGYLNRQQKINLGSNCFTMGTIVHELLHTLGFHHQHNASDRDNYVRIHFENIEKGQEHNFQKYAKNVVSDYGVGYDYESIMHYGPTAFSRNKISTTIEVLQRTTSPIGQNSALSSKDIQKLNYAYKCYATNE